MGREEIGAYVFLAGYGLLLLGATKVFGVRRMTRFLLAIVLVGIWIALGTLRGLAARRY